MFEVEVNSETLILIEEDLIRLEEEEEESKDSAGYKPQKQKNKMSKKIVLKVELNCEKCKQRVMKTIAGVEGVNSVEVDMKEKKVTVIGDPDPVCLVGKLRKFGSAEVVSVGPAKEPEKKQPEKEVKKEDKDKKKGEPANKKEKNDTKEGQKDAPNPMPNITYLYVSGSCEPWSEYNYCQCNNYCQCKENPNACSIC